MTQKYALLLLILIASGCIGQPSESNKDAGFAIDGFMKAAEVEFSGIKGNIVLPVVPESFSDSVKIRTAVWDFPDTQQGVNDGIVFIAAEYSSESEALEKVERIFESFENRTKSIIPPIVVGTKQLEGRKVYIVQIGSGDTTYYWTLGQYAFLARQINGERFGLDDLAKKSFDIFENMQEQ